MALSPAALEDYRALLGEVNRLAQEDLVRLWRSLEHLDKDQLWAALRAGVPEIVEMYRATAADTAMVFYADTQDLSFSAADGLAASRVNRAQVEASMRWALFAEGNTAPLALLAGIVQKHVIDGSREYGLQGFSNAGSGWHRAARPGACEFCRMLATRSVARGGWAPYSSAEAATKVGRGKTSRPSQANQPHGAEFHDNCMCIPVKAELYQPPSYVEKWTAEYYSAVGEVGNSFDYRAVLAAMRKNG